MPETVQRIRTSEEMVGIEMIKLDVDKDVDMDVATKAVIVLKGHMIIAV